MAYMTVLGEDAYLGVCDYHHGDQLWRSSDGTNWELMFQAPCQAGSTRAADRRVPRAFVLVDNDLKRGFELWRTDEVVVAEATTTTLTSDTTGDTTVTSSGGGTTTAHRRWGYRWRW